jgi:2-amino-4-hydroxy-6-hydroxymethyldihydropteridine diphosphokinase
VTAVVSLGTNLGDRLGRLRAGMDVLSMHVGITAVAPVYETAAVGVTDQPAFLNTVALVDAVDPEIVLTAAHAAEQAQDRLRTDRWGPRTLDVDVIAVDAIVTDDPRLTLPHPRAHERAFVLLPWLDVDPVAELPGRGSVRSLLEQLGREGVTAYSDPLPRS